MVKILERFEADHSGPSQLSVSVAVREGEDAVVEFGRVKDALLKRQSSRGGSPDTLAIEIETEEAQRNETLNLFLNIVSEQDPLVCRFYQNVKEAELCLMTHSGKRIKKVGFSHAPA